MQNCRLGFGITTGKYASAKADMEAQRKAGTLHSINTLPSNLAVPVYVDTASKYEHVLVYNKGTWWSDGKKVSGWRATGSRCFGWGELCDGTKVVAWKNGQTVQPTKGFFPSKGYWRKGDNDARIGKLCSFYADKFYGYFCKNKKDAHKLLDGNYFGDNCQKWTKEFQKRTKLVQDGQVGPKTYAKLKTYGFGG